MRYLTVLDVPRVAAGQPTPWLGLNERLSFLAWLAWMAVLSVTLLREHVKQGSRAHGIGAN